MIPEANGGKLYQTMSSSLILHISCSFFLFFGTRMSTVFHHSMANKRTFFFFFNSQMWLGGLINHNAHSRKCLCKKEKKEKKTINHPIVKNREGGTISLTQPCGGSFIPAKYSRPPCILKTVNRQVHSDPATETSPNSSLSVATGEFHPCLIFSLTITLL